MYSFESSNTIICYKPSVGTHIQLFLITAKVTFFETQSPTTFLPTKKLVEFKHRILLTLKRTPAFLFV